MQATHSRTAKSARRKFSLTLLSVLVVIAAASIVVYAAVTEAPGYFTLKASPSTQTVTPGQTAGYVIELDRQNQFIDPVTLTVSNLPGFTSVDYHPGPIPGSSSHSTVTVQTNVGGTTPMGSRQLTIKGTAGSVTSSATVTLNVLAPGAANFTLAGRPTLEHVTENDSAAFSIAIARAGSFTGPVALSASGLPRGTTAAFTGSNPDVGGMTLTTDSSAQPGRYPITVTGVGVSGSTTLSRSTTVILSVEEKKPFGVRHGPVSGLSPGTSKPLNMALSNPHNFDILVREVAVSLDPYSSSPSCGVKANFGVDQMPSSVYPLTIPAGSTRTLSQLGVPESQWPRVKMLNLPVSQDGCKGAQITLQFSGAATKK
jgi:uncharacterized membrane protein